MKQSMKAPRDIRRRFVGVDPKKSRFKTVMFEQLLSDMQSGRLPLNYTTITDDVQAGLRVKIRKTGRITFHVNYDAPEYDEHDPDSTKRPFLLLGKHPEMTVERARRLADIVRELADRGVDPQEGLHKRLIREIEDKGVKWRP